VLGVFIGHLLLSYDPRRSPSGHSAGGAVHRAVTIWSLGWPHSSPYADVECLGTYKSVKPTGCLECEYETQQLVSPLLLTFADDSPSNVVGDFVWPMFEPVLRKQCALELSRKFSGFKLGTVRIVAKPHDQRKFVKVGCKILGRYDFRWLIPTVTVAADMSMSTLKVEERCPKCGKPVYHVKGMEIDDLRYDRKKDLLMRVRRRRKEGMGIFVRGKALGNASIFRVAEQSGAILCRDDVKRYIQDNGWTNVSLLEIGDIV
jgi:hypothetical protein